MAVFTKDYHFRNFPKHSESFGKFRRSITHLCNSSPGPDGYTPAFFRYFWAALKPLVWASMKEIFEKGELPLDFNLSITTFIPKKGKARDKIKCLRPISLLNVLYKLLSKILSTRLSAVLEPIINRDQTGFIKGRYIGGKYSVNIRRYG